MKKTIFIALSALMLVACGEKAQTAGGVKQDAPPYSGTGKPFADSGWKQGDETSWAAHLKTRAQNSQNEYTRVN